MYQLPALLLLLWNEGYRYQKPRSFAFYLFKLTRSLLTTHSYLLTHSGKTFTDSLSLNHYSLMQDRIRHIVDGKRRRYLQEYRNAFDSHYEARESDSDSDCDYDNCPICLRRPLSIVTMAVSGLSCWVTLHYVYGIRVCAPALRIKIDVYVFTFYAQPDTRGHRRTASSGASPHAYRHRPADFSIR